MLFDKLKSLFRHIFKKRHKIVWQRDKAEITINHILKINNYKECIQLLESGRLQTEIAQKMVRQINEDVRLGITSFKKLGVTEKHLNWLLKWQIMHNLRMRFYLLNNPWYQKMGGGIIIQEIEELIKDNKTTWRDLTIDRAEFYSIKNHIKAAK